MATQFEQLGPDDAQLLAHHFITWRREEGVALDPAFARQEVSRLLRNDQSWHLWLIRAGQSVVGYLVLQFRNSTPLEAPRATLAALYVEPQARGKGIGRQAHRFVLDLGRWLQVRIFACDMADEDQHLSALVPTIPAQPGWLDTFQRQAIA